jgi:hypothetical protein
MIREPTTPWATPKCAVLEINGLEVAVLKISAASEVKLSKTFQPPCATYVRGLIIPLQNIMQTSVVKAALFEAKHILTAQKRCKLKHTKT